MTGLALLTSGGDAPGMNMALWAAARAAEQRGWTVLGVREGFSGLLRGDWERWPADRLRPFARLGGTVLATSRLPDFAQLAGAAAQRLREAEIGAALILGGNGSLLGAERLAAAGVNVIGLPATIDNDVPDSAMSIGFDSAVNFALLLSDALLDTAEALPRLCALETLGGDTGHLATAVGQACGSDVALIPEAPLSQIELTERVRAALDRRKYALIVASEGYPQLDDTLRQLSDDVGLRLRLTRLGHAQRGGRPSAADRLLALSLAESAVLALAEGHSGVMAWQGQPVLHEFSPVLTKEV